MKKSPGTEKKLSVRDVQAPSVTSFRFELNSKDDGARGGQYRSSKEILGAKISKLKRFW